MFYPKTPFYGKPLLENEILKVNHELLSQLLQWLCETPRVTTYRVNNLRTNVDAYKKELEAKLTARYGVHAPKVYGIDGLPELLCIEPLIAKSQHNPTLKELMVDTSCGAALLRGAHIYAPGVLAMESGTQFHELVNVYADLNGKCKRGTATRFECEQKIFLGTGEVLMQRYQLYNNNAQPMTGIAVQMQTNITGVAAMGDLSNAEALLQNLPSVVCVRVLAPQADEVILDMCAAPGNKTSHIAELISDRGRIIALDNAAARVRAMQPKLKHYNSIESHIFNSTLAHSPELEATNLLPSQPPYPSGSFDRILLDAPCSGLGNRPQLACRIKNLKTLQSYPHIQRRLFTQAVPLLKTGGVLVYSTCSVTEAECEQIVSWALVKFPNIRLADATPKFGGQGLPNLGLTSKQCELVQRFGMPSTNRVQNLDTMGFFIAKFIKE